MLLALIVGYLLPRPLFKWVPASYQHEAEAHSVSRQENEKPVQVFLLPTDGFDYHYTTELAAELAKRTGLEVKAVLPTPLDSIEPFPETNQFNAAALLEKATPTIGRLRQDYGDGIAIVLTNRDINSPERTTRFVFSFHDWNQRISTLSSARLTLGIASQKADLETVKDRLLKFSLRIIGEQYFKLPRSTDSNTVMFSPIMSLHDVDRMGTELPFPK